MKNYKFTIHGNLYEVEVLGILLIFSLTWTAFIKPEADVFLTKESVLIFGLGACAFAVATLSGVLFAKAMNIFLPANDKINPFIGNAGVSAVPDSARVSEMEGLKADKTNHLLMHAMGPNVAGVIGSAIASGILLGYLG